MRILGIVALGARGATGLLFPAVSSIGGLRTPALPCAPHHLHGAGIRKPSQSRRFGDVRV